MRLMASISVIIPNYNHARYLEQRIASVLTQTFTDFELIILDDASTDNSKEIIEKYAAQDRRISFYPSTLNSGSPFVQWNKGVKLAKADLIWIAESDDVASPEFLQAMLAAHNNNPGIALAYCQSYRMNDEGTITGTWKTVTDDRNEQLFNNDFVMEGMKFINDFLIHKNVIPNASAVLFRKSVYNEVNGAEEKLKTNSDWLTWLKMLLSYKVAFVSQPLNYFRYHSKSVIASLSATANTSYQEQYDLTLRVAFEKHCAASAIVLPASVLQQNRKYKSFDYGTKGVFEFRKGFYNKGLINLLRASLFPKPTLGYFKRLIKNRV